MKRPRRLQVPTARLPRDDKRFTSGVAVSAMVHGGALLVFVIVAASTAEVFTALAGPGPAGGGGGGGNAIVRYMELPAWASSEPAAEVPETEPVELALPQPNLTTIPEQIQTWQPPALRRPTLQAVQLGRGPGAGGGPGAGTGTGGGAGSGQGTGVGSGVGPGSGTGDGTAFPPEPRFIIVPADRPSSVRGREFQVRFWVNATGRVTRVEVEPSIEDSEYRRKFLDQMYQFQFTPARTMDGTPVDGVVVIPITL
jgi:TonB family protein